MSQTASLWKRATVLVLGIALLTTMPALAGQKVLRIVFDGPVMESPSEEAQLFAILGGSKSATLHEWVTKFDEAAESDSVAGIALIIAEPQFGLAQLTELADAMKRFRETGKKIYCYLDHAGNGYYALACAADHITLAEHSEIAIMGFNAELSFYKGLLDKIGVHAEMLHCGAYKSALEPYTRTEPSPEAAENLNWLLDGIFETWIGMMAEGRGIPADQMRKFVDHGLFDAAAALEAKLVDNVSSFTEFKSLIRETFGEEAEVVKDLHEEAAKEFDLENNPFAFFQLIGDMLQEAQRPPRDGIGLIYLEGAIVMGKSQDDPFSGKTAGSTTIRAAFTDAAENENVKAVVVRINSPGGSALASDIMWKAAMACAEKKPVIVSMGNVAGSGGYYTACPGELIFADENTITASIGVVGGKLVWKELMEEKLGITTTSFQRGKHADLMTMNRTWTDSERQFVDDMMNRIYEQFKQRIRTTRGDRLKGDLDDMAGGRVFTGKQALALGLVDRIGGLHDALEYTRKKAGLDDDYELYVFPEARNIMEEFIAELTGQPRKDEWEFAFGPQAMSDPFLRVALPLLQKLAPAQARGLQEALVNLRILSTEHVGCFMPAGINIR